MLSAPARIDLPADASSTERFGAWLGSRLRPGDTVALVGDLGAGKTTLVRGLARGLGVDDPDAVQSPTYLLVVEHPGPIPLLHADAYLPKKLVGFLEDGGLEYLFDRRAAVVIEWADRVADLLPEATLWVELALATTGGRRLTVRCARPTDYAFVAEMPKMF